MYLTKNNQAIAFNTRVKQNCHFPPFFSKQLPFPISEVMRLLLLPFFPSLCSVSDGEKVCVGEGGVVVGQWSEYSGRLDERNQVDF